MDYISGNGFPGFINDRTTESRQQQSTSRENSTFQPSGSWRNFFGEHEDTKETYHYKGSDSAGRMNANKKSKIGIYLLILVLVTFLTISLIAMAVLSTLLFFKDDTDLKVTEFTAVNANLDPTHHCQENTPDAKSCAEGWLFSNTSCYWLNSESLNWDDAEAACRRLDSTLVEITTDEEFRIIGSLITGDFWIGGRHQEESEHWIYSCSNKSNSFTNMYVESEPESKLCLGMISKTELKSIYVNHCDTSQPSLCEGNFLS